ncbi:MAG: cation-translocating P-type ATPase [Promethearchaeota archaeon]
MDENYQLELEEIFDKFQTDKKKGLTEDEASKRLQEYGFNEIPPAPENLWKVYLAPLFNWLIIIYFIAAIILLIAGLITGDNNMGLIYITLAIVGLNSIVAVIQQARATKKLKALKDLAAPTTNVIRNGQREQILTKNVVIGDLLLLNTGDRVPADARLIEATNLEVNESSLTGESEPVKKSYTKALKIENLPLQSQENMLFYGTYVVMGNALAIVVQTGQNTEIGKISQGLQESNSSEIPIRKKLNNIGKWFGIGVMLAWIAVIIILYFTTGRIEIISSLYSAMDIMPINIPLLTTIVMLTGVLVMAETGIVVRNLTSVDSLGRVSVVCSDKTGTLTKGQMSVQHIWVRGSRFSVSGSGYIPEGKITLRDKINEPVDVENIDDFPHLKLLLTAGFLNNNASLIKHEFEVGKKILTDWKVLGSPTEGALVSLYQKIMNKDDVAHFKLIHEYPFSSFLKRMSKVFKNTKDGKYYVFTKGASEILITSCSKLLGDENKSFDFIDEMKLVVMNTTNEYARQGYRILSLAYNVMDELPKDVDEEELRDIIEKDLIYIGFVAIMDPPRDGVKESIEKCHNAGINVIMITGDSLMTAKAIASQISILSKENGKEMAIEGNKIEKLENSDDFFNIKVFARVTPKHKQIIVERYKAAKKIVAMTGDGVNDALALNMADAGIAMGISGTDVAKEASDMIISDDSFSSIVKGVHQGRGIFANIRSLIFFFICTNLFEGIVQFILAVILQKPYFLSDEFYYQWVYLSLTLHTIPGLILTFDTISKNVMKETPRNSEEIISKKYMFLLVTYGIFLALAMLVVYFLCINGTYPVFKWNTELNGLNSYYLFTDATKSLWQGVDLINAKTLTMLMTTLYFCECALALQIRRPNMSLIRSLKEEGNKFMYIIVGVLFLIYLSLMYIPGLQIALATSSFGIQLNFMFLTPWDWLVCIAIAFFCCIGPFELVKYFSRKKGIFY